MIWAYHRPCSAVELRGFWFLAQTNHSNFTFACRDLGRAFGRTLTIKMSLPYWSYTWALHREKSKSPLFPGLAVAVVTNDMHNKLPFQIIELGHGRFYKRTFILLRRSSACIFARLVSHCCPLEEALAKECVTMTEQMPSCWEFLLVAYHFVTFAHIQYILTFPRDWGLPCGNFMKWATAQQNQQNNQSAQWRLRSAWISWLQI